MSTAEDVFEDAMRWLQEHYDEHTYYSERDIESTLQKMLISRGQAGEHRFVVYNNHTMRPGRERADLVLCDPPDGVIVAVEIKYEPSKERSDILPTKFPVTSWTEIVENIAKVRLFVESARCRTGYAIVIDEGGQYTYNDPPDGSRWLDWESAVPRKHRVSVLWTRFPVRQPGP